MKKLLTILALILAGLNTSFAQMDSLKFDKLLLDFTVPDMPAFKALGTDPSDILRPSDIKKFAIMMSPFLANGKGVIPNSFALEVAPFKLLDPLTKSPLTMKDVTSKGRGFRKFLYHTSLSLGSNQTENELKKKVNNLSIGLRTTFVGKKGDIYRSGDLDSIYLRMSDAQTIKNRIEKEWVESKKITLAELSDPNNPKTKELQKIINKIIQGPKGSPSAEIDKLIKKFNAEKWNANRGEIAVAWVGQSPDSLIGNVRSSHWNFWGVYANSLGSKKSQLLIGSTVKYFESTTPAKAGWDATFNARIYHGNKDFRAFAEYQFKKMNISDANTGLINIGSELRVLKEFWVVFSGGVENLYATDSKSSFVSKFDIRYSFNKPN